jgi:outer membrane biosynthesis protein TonB
VQIQSSPRPDLNAEALKLVSTWKFLPLLCNDAPATVDGDFVVHFQGR